MGYRKIPTIHTLDEIANEDGLIVRMKSIRVGKLRRIIRVTEADDLEETLEEMIDLITLGLVSWNLEDENGTPVPSDREGVEGLEMDLLISILNSWLENITGVSEDLGKDSPSGGKSPVRSLTMEAL